MTTTLNDGATTDTAIYRKNYTPPPFWIDHVELVLDLDPAKTRVLNKMRLRRNPQAAEQALRLDGEDLSLARVLCQGQGISFKIDGNTLVLENLPTGEEAFDLEIFTVCSPEKNTKLMGLYLSQGTFFTQCEAEGFRRITYFLDRPDVMASYRVTLKADRTRFPILLSNGNLVEQGILEDGRGFAIWDDPHRKPCYLFALVAGDLACREQAITSRSGTPHLLQIYVRPADLNKTEYAMQSLMAAIAWDETRFGLGLDLERYMIVAVGDFNMGAMENKGLNIFNTKYVLAHPSNASDTDFANVQSVVAHEYFHNWTGNRVTCRDWFQLSLKEGLTVFRDQEFSQDMAGSPSARAVCRIEDVRTLRSHQFAEDAGPMAHPVRPDSYVEINNFYTSTVYEKGAEVVRMMQTLVGRDGFAQGMALYFQRHDGQAVTCDDFVQAIADANPNSALATHLETFKRWYAQAGTPRVRVQTRYEGVGEEQHLILDFAQHTPATPGQSEKQAQVIPIRFGLLDAQSGAPVPCATADTIAQADTSDAIFLLHQEQASLRIPTHGKAVVPSLLRGFSAPVVLDHDYSPEALLLLLQHDGDPYNRWEAAQKILLTQILAAVQASDAETAHRSETLSPATLDALRRVLRDPSLDPALKELILTLPSEGYIAEQLDHYHPHTISSVHASAQNQIAQTLHQDWEWAQQEYRVLGAYSPAPASAGRRALANLAQHMLLLRTNAPTTAGKAYQKVKDAGNMTDCYAALHALVKGEQPLADAALAHFYQRFAHDDLALDKWFSLQAATCDSAQTVQNLMRHPDFKISNPNRARSVIFAFCNSNHIAFHQASGYAFWAESIKTLDSLNPQVAARLARSMDKWKKWAAPLQNLAQTQIEKALSNCHSKDVREILEKTL